MTSKNSDRVTVNAGHVVHVHADHVDGLHAPDAAGLAENGIATASARPVVAGENVPVPGEAIGDLEGSGTVRRPT